MPLMDVFPHFSLLPVPLPPNCHLPSLLHPQVSHLVSSSRPLRPSLLPSPCLTSSSTDELNVLCNSTTASAYLLISQYLYHPSPTSLLHPFSSGQSLQLATVGLHLACHAINATVIGPKTTVVMKKRARLEREEGKAYNAEGVSSSSSVDATSRCCGGRNADFGTW